MTVQLPVLPPLPPAACAEAVPCTPVSTKARRRRCDDANCHGGSINAEGETVERAINFGILLLQSQEEPERIYDLNADADHSEE